SLKALRAAGRSRVSRRTRSESSLRSILPVSQFFSNSERGPERHSRETVVRLRREHLVHLGVAVLEVDRGRRDVEAPDPGSGHAGVGDGGFPVALEVRQPRAQRQGIVLAQTLDVSSLESRALDGGDDRPDFAQLTVGEDEAVDEAAPIERGAAAGAPRAADAVIEEPAAGTEQRVEPREVLVELAQANVLEHADRADRVERAV